MLFVYIWLTPLHYFCLPTLDNIDLQLSQEMKSLQQKKKKKSNSICKWKELRNMYVFVQINLQMSLILKEVLNNAQELVTGNSSRWHKSTDFSFHTISEIPRAAQSVTHSKLQGILTVSDGFLNAYYIFMESDHWYKLSFSKLKKNWKNICALRVPPSRERMGELYIISL